MGSTNRSEDFKVVINRKNIVAAALPLQEHWLPLSNLDLLLPPVDVSVFFCYEKPTSNVMNFPSMVGCLKNSLSQSLVSYFVFVGEVVPNPAGEPELLCNNRGVDFVEAFADIELREINLYNPDDSVEGKFIPKKHCGVLAIQATKLKCGGLIVGCTFDHRVADAYSINMFLISWSQMAQSNPISISPSFCRSLLNPRQPLFLNSSLDNLYILRSKLPPPKQSPLFSDDHLISRIYYVSADKIRRLQLLASSSVVDEQRSKLECFSAFLWKMVAKYASKGICGGDEICNLGIVVDGRTRLSDKIDDEMMSYFGNVLSIPFIGLKVSELMEKSLSQLGDQVHEMLRNVVTKKHFLDLIDWVEAHRPEMGLAKIYGVGSGRGSGFVVSSGQRFSVSDVDFGWGKAVFGSYHFPWGGDTGYVMPMPSPVGNGDWVVYMHLLKGQLEFIESEASQVLKPFSFECLQIN